jgi:Zn ribbon nucleic-acid-binding protein
MVEENGMSKLAKVFTVEVTINSPLSCPHCKALAEVVDNGDSFHVECFTCGVAGFRYMEEEIARRDFKDHHCLPRIKPDK